MLPGGVAGQGDRARVAGHVKDEFGDKPKYAAPLGALGVAAMTAGVGIFAVGVLQAL